MKRPRKTESLRAALSPKEARASFLAAGRPRYLSGPPDLAEGLPCRTKVQQPGFTSRYSGYALGTGQSPQSGYVVPFDLSHRPTAVLRGRLAVACRCGSALGDPASYRLSPPSRPAF